MKVNDVLDLRKQGRVEEAYDAIRLLYANDRGPYTSSAMFWTAVDILKVRLRERRMDEAHKILLALERMLPNVPDKEGWVQNAMTDCRQLLGKKGERENTHDVGPARQELGMWGEDLAAAYLRDKDYVILERDWHSGHRDIDIIARHEEYYVFVEVKTRRNTDFGNPVMAVDYKKRRNLRLAMNHYIRLKRINNPVRFDIITVVGTQGSEKPIINHLVNVEIMELSYRR